MKYAFIRAHSQQYMVSRLCKVLGVTSSGYYIWRDRPESVRARQNLQLVTTIKVFHKASRETYGSPRFHYDLVDTGAWVGVNRVARLMRQHGIQSKRSK